METVNLNQTDFSTPGQAVIAAQALAGTGSFEQVALVQIPLPSPRHPRSGDRILRLVGTVGASALTGLRVTEAVTRGGTHVLFREDAGWATTSGLLLAATTNPHTTAAGGTFELVLRVDGLAEIAVWAKSASATSLAMEIGH